MAIGVRQGVDPKLLFECMKKSTGQPWMLEDDCPVPNAAPGVPSSNGHQPGFKSQIMVKDISLGVEAGRAVGIEPRTAEVVLSV
jgi:3-hydroxyisobutyrate/3-hydroxypropionate dehydrogenase